jgi:hypothetical protein
MAVLLRTLVYRLLKSILCILILSVSISSAISESSTKINPADYSIGMSYSVKQAEFIPYSMDVPFFVPDYTIDAVGGYTSDLNFNLAFYPNTTQIKIAFRLKPKQGVSIPSEVRFRFYYWPEYTLPKDSFGDEYKYATDITFRLETKEGGSEYVKVIEDVQGMPYMQATKLKYLSKELKPRDWNEVELSLTTVFDFPERQWINGVELENNQATGEAVAREYRKLHEVFQSGYEKTFNYYKALLENQGKSYGISAKEWFDDSGVSLLAKGEIELLPYDNSSSELGIYGNGRLTALIPSPITGKTEYGQQYEPVVYFWKDQQGNWHLAD